jgi:sterol desaturase/sphingolipid hydroxylase (fatty acid hydroxylase superfamily)
LEQQNSPRQRLRHDARNLTWGLINTLLTAYGLAGLLVALVNWAGTQHIGLLRQLAWAPWLETCLAVVLMDLWTYGWHRLNHTVPLLWRFHRMHHSDTAMNVSTAARFHPGEIMLSRVAWLVVVPLWGVTLTQLALYQICLTPVVLLHHSNLRLPRWLDRGLTAVLVSPAMHRVHHSRLPTETHSNYGALLPWWDWLFGSFRWRHDTENIEIGLDAFADPKWQTLSGMARTPLEKPRPPKPHK